MSEGKVDWLLRHEPEIRHFARGMNLMSTGTGAS